MTITGDPCSTGALPRISHLDAMFLKNIGRESWRTTPQFVAIHCNQVSVFRRNKGESAHTLSRPEDTPLPPGKTPSNLERPRARLRGDSRGDDLQLRSGTPTSTAGTTCCRPTRVNYPRHICL